MPFSVNESKTIQTRGGKNFQFNTRKFQVPEFSLPSKSIDYFLNKHIIKPANKIKLHLRMFFTPKFALTLNLALH